MAIYRHWPAHAGFTDDHSLGAKITFFDDFWPDCVALSKKVVLCIIGNSNS